MTVSHISIAIDTRDNYVITGILKSGIRFDPIYTKTPQHCNIWKGNIWKSVNGKRKLIKRINN